MERLALSETRVGIQAPHYATPKINEGPGVRSLGPLFSPRRSQLTHPPARHTIKPVAGACASLSSSLGLVGSGNRRHFLDGRYLGEKAMDNDFICQPCQQDTGEWLVVIEVPMQDEADARAWSNEFEQCGDFVFYVQPEKGCS